MRALLLRMLRAFRGLVAPRRPFCPEEDPSRPAWNREAWKRAQRRGYRPSRER